MADEQEKKSSDEYQYPDEYFGGDYKPETIEETEEEPIRERRPGTRRVLIALGLIGTILLVYGLLTFLGRGRTADQVTPPSPVVQQTPVTPQVVAPAPPVQPMVSEDVVRAMQQQIQNNQATIATLQSQMQQIQNQLSQMAQTLSGLTTQIQVAAGEIKALADERLIGEGRALLRPQVAGPVYYLKALVPGRAWLQTARRGGPTITVTVGDRLPGYGIIQMIDTTQGILTTSSGRLIQYGPRDS